MTPFFGRNAAFSGLGESAGDAVDELDRVKLNVAVETETDTLPAGATGTVVTVWAPGQAFEVEFTKPFPALVTLKRNQVTPVRSARG